MRLRVWLLGAGLSILVLPASAGAQTVPDANCAALPSINHYGDLALAQTFTAQNSGAITSAQVRMRKSGAPGAWTLSINTVGPTGTPTDTTLASTDVSDAGIPNDSDATITGEFASPAAVTAGQQYALAIRRPGSNNVAVINETDPCPGQLYFYTGGTFTSGDPALDMIFAVFVTLPDPEPLDTQPPNTTITAGPKDKTKKRTATIEFTTDEPGSTFDCSLDGKSIFKPCTSPLTVRVKRGKHTVQVQATDPAGNVDTSPATDDWKVKRKRKE